MIDAALERLTSAGVVAVLRGPDAKRTAEAAEILVSGGITGLEVTFTTPGAEKAITAIRSRHAADVVVGAGTVCTGEQAEAAVAAGAQFLVAPGTDPELVTAMIAPGVPVIAGALTPSEVMTALRLGAHVVKLFPASLGGPAYLRALRGPFPDVPFMPAGGVTPENLGTWLDAGAVAVGAGSELASTADLAAGDHQALAAKARRFVSALRMYRGLR